MKIIKLNNFSINLTKSVALSFSRAALKLLAFLIDLLKLRILFRIGSGRTLVSNGESDGTGVLFFSWFGDGSLGLGGVALNS